MSIHKKGDRLKVKIEKLITGGAGLARSEGKVVFVDYSAPGDELEILIYESKSSFSRGKILNIIHPSPLRAKPRCEVFGRCGGCQWQHINYDAQIDAKQNILSEVISRFLPDEKLALEPFVKSPQQYQYRNRIQVRSEQGQVGYYEKKSHDLVSISRCPIAEESINNEMLNWIKTKPQTGKYRLQIGLSEKVEVINIGLQDEPLGFAQINRQQNERLQKDVLSAYLKMRGSPVVDLYGGYGNLSFPLAKDFSSIKIECVEWNQQAVAEGISRAKKENIKNIHFINNDVGTYLHRVHLPESACVIMDPPREGCDPKVIRELASKLPKMLIYVSCDPMTWGRDVQMFLNEASQRGQKYRIATIHGLDMFPQTDHIEVFSVFEKI